MKTKEFPATVNPGPAPAGSSESPIGPKSGKAGSSLETGPTRVATKNSFSRDFKLKNYSVSGHYLFSFLW